jgi:hypothetical protein
VEEQFGHESAGMEEDLEGLATDDVGLAALGQVTVHLAQQFLL